MYSENDLLMAKKRVQRLSLIALAILGIFLTLSIILAVYVNNRLGELVLIFGTCLDIFFWGTKATPSIAYYRFIKNIVTGLSRSQQGIVIKISSEPVYKDNRVFYYEVLTRDEVDGKERLLLWDIYKPIDNLQEGQKYEFKVHDNFIIDIQAL